MNDSPLTQHDIDAVVPQSESTQSGLISKAVSHPVLAGGMVLVGAGLAYATAKAIKNATGEQVARDVHLETSIMIDKSPQELYTFWRDFKNLPLFMKHLESVTTMDDGRTHWVARGVGGISKVEWDAEIYNEIENEMIAWRSVDSADVVNAGSVRFQAAPQGHGTYVRVTLNYNPPAGSVGMTLAQLLGKEPGQVIKEELRRLKQLMETGEIAAIDGQSSGRAEDAVRITAESHSNEGATADNSNGS